MTDVVTGAAGRPLSARGLNTRRKLLDAAERVFGELGYVDASIVKLTEEAGVGQGTFYLYFDSKRAIFDELVRDLNRRVRHAMKEASSQGETRLESELLGFQAYFRFTADHPALYRIIRQAEFVSPEMLHYHYDRLSEGYIAALREASESGEIASLDPEVTAWALMGLGELIGMRWILWGGNDEIPPARPRRARADHPLRPRGPRVRPVGLEGWWGVGSRAVEFQELQPGLEAGPSAWIDVTQERIDEFARVTGDLQSIHVDPALAAAGPFGTTVAHGLLTLSLDPGGDVPGASGRGRTIVNYGLNRVRFPAPVPAGSRVRVSFRVESVDPVEGGVHACLQATVELDGAAKPACVAELVLRCRVADCRAQRARPAERHLDRRAGERAAAVPSRNATVAATSSGSISRFTAWGARITSSSTRSRAARGRGPGRRSAPRRVASACTRGRPPSRGSRCGAPSSASVFTSPMTPCLAET